MGLRSEKLVKNDMNLYKSNKDKMEQGMQARRPRSAFVFVSPTFFFRTPADFRVCGLDWWCSDFTFFV